MADILQCPECSGLDCIKQSVQCELGADLGQLELHFIFCRNCLHRTSLERAEYQVLEQWKASKPPRCPVCHSLNVESAKGGLYNPGIDKETEFHFMACNDCSQVGTVYPTESKSLASWSVYDE